MKAQIGNFVILAYFHLETQTVYKYQLHKLRSQLFVNILKIFLEPKP